MQPFGEGIIPLPSDSVFAELNGSYVLTPKTKALTFLFLSSYKNSTHISTVFSAFSANEVMIMIVARQMEIRANIKRYFDMASDGEEIIVSRKQSRNVVILSEERYNALKQYQRLEAYAEKTSTRRNSQFFKQPMGMMYMPSFLRKA